MNATVLQQYSMLFIVMVTYPVWYREAHADSSKRESRVETDTCYYHKERDEGFNRRTAEAFAEQIRVELHLYHAIDTHRKSMITDPDLIQN